ncbi:DHA2 family efflux MFS transporter permease subunit [Sphingobium herbicidovorans]|nr:DHA2 family efflux MFS transporter permease subunit [Kaistia sp.]
MTALAVPEPRAVPAQGGGILIAAVLLACITEAVASTVLSLGRGDIIGDTYATPDEFAWLDMGYTTLKLMGYIAAPSLIARFDPRKLLLLSTIIMGAACALAALTADLETLVVLRVLQGFAGGVLLISGQTLLFLAYPQSQQPIVQALFALGSVVAPATLAPALQGWLLDNQSWTWIFFGNAPIAIMAAGLLLMAKEQPPTSFPSRPFDWLGFVLLSAVLACVTYICSQGSRWDWFEESRIVWLTVAAAAAFLAFIAREIAARGRTLLDFSAFRSDDFAFAFVVSFVAGAALFGSAYLIPSFAVSVLAFTPTDAGQLLLPSGGLFVAALLLAAFLMQAGKVPPIATVPFGILLIMLAMWMLSGSTSQSGSSDMMPAILLRGLGLGFLFLSIQLIAFCGLPRPTLASGIGMFNVGRQLGGLMGVAALQTLIDHHVAGNQAVLGAHITAGAPDVAERIATLTSALVGRGMDAAAASKAATMLLGRTVAGQSTVIAFDTAFNAIALLFVVAAPFLIAVKIAVSRAGKARRARLSVAEGG